MSRMTGHRSTLSLVVTRGLGNVVSSRVQISPFTRSFPSSAFPRAECPLGKELELLTCPYVTIRCLRRSTNPIGDLPLPEWIFIHTSRLDLGGIHSTVYPLTPLERFPAVWFLQYALRVSRRVFGYFLYFRGLWEISLICRIGYFLALAAAYPSSGQLYMPSVPVVVVSLSGD